MPLPVAPLRDEQKTPIPVDIATMPVARPAKLPIQEMITSPFSGLPSEVILTPDENDFPIYEILAWHGKWRSHRSGKFGPWLSFEAFTRSTPGVVEEARTVNRNGRPVLREDGIHPVVQVVLDPRRWAARIVLAGGFRMDDLNHPDGTVVGMPSLRVRRSVEMYDWAEDRLCHPEVMAQLIERHVRINRDGIPRGPSVAWDACLGRLASAKRLSREDIEDARAQLNELQGKWRSAMLGGIEIAASRGLSLDEEDAPPASPLERARADYFQTFGRQTFSQNTEFILQQVRAARKQEVSAPQPISAEPRPLVASPKVSDRLERIAVAEKGDDEALRKATVAIEDTRASLAASEARAAEMDAALLEESIGDLGGLGGREIVPESEGPAKDGGGLPEHVDVGLALVASFKAGDIDEGRLSRGIGRMRSDQLGDLAAALGLDVQGTRGEMTEAIVAHASKDIDAG